MNKMKLPNGYGSVSKLSVWKEGYAPSYEGDFMIKTKNTWTVSNIQKMYKEKVEEIFFRLNNSTTLTKTQVAKAKIGTVLAIFLLPSDY